MQGDFLENGRDKHRFAHDRLKGRGQPKRHLRSDIPSTLPRGQLGEYGSLARPAMLARNIPGGINQLMV